MSLSSGREWLHINASNVNEIIKSALDMLSKSSLSPLFVFAGHALPKVKRALSYILVEVYNTLSQSPYNKFSLSVPSVAFPEHSNTYMCVTLIITCVFIYLLVFAM
jgi:hypothetical protein